MAWASSWAAVKEEPRIIWQDKHMAVLSKSAGWIVAISRHKEQNKYFDKLLQESAVREAKELVDSGRCEHLCHFIALKFKEDSSFQLSNNLSCEWGIAHRLDVDTSGAIMIGKTAEGFRHLREAFSSHVVFKEYLCLVHGAVKESSGEVNQPILWDCGTNTSCISSSGDWAQTFFTRVGHYRLKGGNQVFSLCRIVIVTGRTHQIRVHMASIGHPLVSDGKYNSKNKTDLMWCPRMFLHAWRLGFYDLFYTWQEVRTSLPSDLRKALRMLSEIKIDVMRPDDPSCRVIHASRPQDVGTKRKAEASPPEAAAFPESPTPVPRPAAEEACQTPVNQSELEEQFCRAAAKVLAAAEGQTTVRSLAAHADLAPLLAKMGEDRPKVSKLLRDRPASFAFLGSGPAASVVTLIQKTQAPSEQTESCDAGTLVQMGFDEAAARKALQANGHRLIEALEQLAEQVDEPIEHPAPLVKPETEPGDLEKVLALSQQEEERRRKQQEMEEEMLRMTLAASQAQPTKSADGEEELSRVLKESLQLAEERQRQALREEEEIQAALKHSQDLEEEERGNLRLSEEEDMRKALEESQRLYELFHAVPDEDAALQAILHPADLPETSAEDAQLWAAIQASYDEGLEAFELEAKAELQKEDLPGLEEAQASFSLRASLQKCHEALGMDLDFDTLWAVLSELDDDVLGDSEALKMWLGYLPEDSIPRALALLVDDFRQKRFLLSFSN